MKLLHSADWHLCAPIQGLPEAQAQKLRASLLELPAKIAALCRAEGCDMMLLSGDLFDGPYTPQSYRLLCAALEEAGVPVFISPGNHDFVGPDSPWLRESWPENVHIFTQPEITAIPLPALSCTVYGAGFSSMDCPSLLTGFQADPDAKYTIGVFHGDPTNVSSPYHPITRAQVQDCNLTYLALGHVHKTNSFRAGKTLCAWPGCPIGKGYDETGVKGVLIAELSDVSDVHFVPLDAPAFYDLQAEATEDPAYVLASLLPATANEDFYRVTLTGSWSAPDLASIREQFTQFPNLTLRDQTTPPTDPWATAGEDSFEGIYFGLLQEALGHSAPQQQAEIQLAARISRQLLDGQEVVLP